MGEGGQADHPFDGFVVFTTGAQQVEESGQKNHLKGCEKQRLAGLTFHHHKVCVGERIIITIQR